MGATATPKRRPVRSLGGLAGVAGVGVPFIGLGVLPIWRFPATTASSEQIAAFAAQHRAASQLMMLLYTVGVTLWLVFGASIWARLRAMLSSESDLPTVFGAGLVGFVTLLMAGFVAFDVLVYRPDVSDARVLYDLTFGMLAMSGLPTAICLAAFSVAVHKHEILPGYTAHLATLAAVAHVLLLLSFVVGSGFFSLEGAVITVIPATLWAWILATGIALLRSDTVAAATRPVAA